MYSFVVFFSFFRWYIDGGQVTHVCFGYLVILQTGHLRGLIPRNHFDQSLKRVPWGAENKKLRQDHQDTH